MSVRLLCLAALVVLAAAPAPAQTAPTPYDLSAGDYVFTAWPETSAPGTYPPSMRFHRGPSQDPALAAEPNADYTAGNAPASWAREEMDSAAYRDMTYYERWIASIEAILIEKNILSKAEIDQKLAEFESKWGEP